ncbi:MAG: CvpA family protein [Thermomicrobiales bacterium]
MTDQLILDAVIVAVVAVFAAIGFVRGVQREIFATAAILGGWAMASSWADRWQTDLADLIQVSNKTAGFIVTTALVLGSFVILGWGAGSAVGAYASGSGQRIAGAALGGINAVLLANYAINTFSDYLGDVSSERVINDSRVAKLVRDDYNYVLAGGMAIAVLLTILALAIGRSMPKQPLPYGRTYPTPSGRETMASDPNEYKVEPVRRAPRSALESTMPIATVDSARLSDSGGRRPNVRFQPQSREWKHTINSQATSPISFPADDDDSAVTVSCKSCGLAVSLSDVYCPHCGRLTR